MKHIRTMLVLMMVAVLVPVVLARTTDVPKVDPKILDVLEKVQAKVRSSDYLSYYVKRRQVELESDRKPWETSGTVWLKRMQSDKLFGADFHLRGEDMEGTFDYFYDGRNSYAVRHKDKKVTVWHVNDFPNTENHPAKARSAVVILQPILFDLNFKDDVLKNCSSTTIGDGEKGLSWVITIKLARDQYGMDKTNFYYINKATKRIDRILNRIEWRGATTEVTVSFSKYQDDEKTVAPHIVMPEKYKPGYKWELYKEKSGPTQCKFEVLFGNAAPEFDYMSLSGNKTALKQFRGKVVVLDFWEAWCGHCRIALPKVNKLQQKWKNKLRVIGIVTESKKTVQKLADYNKLVYPNIIADKSILEKYKVNAFPTYFLIDRDGKIVTASAGDLSRIETTLEKLLKKPSARQGEPRTSI